MREVLLKIKSASHRLEDLEIPCNLSATVKELKKLIQIHNPLHPDVGDQRLIFAGHLLDDIQTLAKVLLPNSEASQSSFTLHLACSSSFFQPQRQQTSSKKQETPSEIPARPQSVPQEQTSFTPNPPSGIPPELLGLHQLYVQQMRTYMTEWSQGRYNTVNWNTTPSQSPLIGGETSQNPGLNGVGNTAAPTAAPVPQPQDIPNEAARAVEAVQAAEAAGRVAAAARVAAAREDDDAPRDVIDWMYTFSRVALIFSVVYFYSNFTRFFLVVVLSALVFVLQRRPFLWNLRQPVAAEAPNAGVQRPAENPPGQQGDEVEQPPDIPNAAGLGVNEAGEQANTGEEVPATGENPVELIVPEPQEGARINPRDVTWTFLTTFFTSLIPEMPQN